MAYVIGLIFLGGCELIQTPKYPEQPGQLLATKIVWNSLYEESISPPPIKWVFGEDCLSDSIPGECFLGEYDSINNTAIVIWRGSFHDSAFAHELFHANLETRYGKDDYNHTNSGFQPGGLVDIANEVLKNAGL